MSKVSRIARESYLNGYKAALSELRSAVALQGPSDLVDLIDLHQRRGPLSPPPITCGRVWYHPHWQEDQVCLLPEGHPPEPGFEHGHGCPGAPLDEEEDPDETR